MTDVYIAGIFLLLGAAIGAGCTWVGAANIARRNERKTAAWVFRMAFQDALSLLRNDGQDAFEIVSRRFIKHEAAVAEFSRYMRTCERERFVAVWKEYTHAEYPQRFLEQYSGKGCSVTQAEERRALAIHRLESLLAFAKP